MTTTTTKATHYHCSCKECYWGTIVESADTAADAVGDHEQKTGHAWVVEGLCKDEDNDEGGDQR